MPYAPKLCASVTKSGDCMWTSILRPSKAWDCEPLIAARQLSFTTTATTLRKDRQPFLLTDGPYAETKEQILGFYVVDFDSQEEAIEFARELGHANPGGAFEIRPMIYFQANDALAESVTAPNVAG